MDGRPYVLLVGSDRVLPMRSALERCGFTVVTSTSPEGALLQYGRHAVEAVVALLPLGGIGATGLCDEISRRGGTPVLTASEHRVDRFNALRAGADEHVRMPCDDKELRARIRALIRRRRAASTTAQVIVIGCLGVVLGRGIVTLDPELTLTAAQTTLLMQLASHHEAVVSDSVLRQVLEIAHGSESTDRLDTDLAELRSIVANASGMANAIERIEGLGCRLTTGRCRSQP
jgi:DNA-binding response OmpR family regulator